MPQRYSVVGRNGGEGSGVAEWEEVTPNGRSSQYLNLQNEKLYHSSAVYASAIHSITLPFRMNKTGPSADSSNETGAMDLHECIQMLAGQARQNRITVLDAAMPAPSITGRRFQQSLLGNLQPLTPETTHDVDDLQAIETMIVHGALGSGCLSETKVQVGLVLDAGIEEELRIRHLQVADATRASLGLPVHEYIVTDTPLEVEKWVDPKSGQATGRIKHPDSLLRAVHTLRDRSLVNVVAVMARFPDDDIDDVDEHRQGKGIDLLAGVEAIISHLVVKNFRIPCAHAPALLPPPLTQSLCPKSAAEELGYTFLPCVLAGLANAPQYLKTESRTNGCIVASDVDSVILPADACGGHGVLAFANKKTKPLIICVQENETVLNDTPEKLGIDVIKVSNYWEAIGVVAAHKAGVDPNSLRRDKIKNITTNPLIRSNGFVASSTRTFA